MSRYKHCVHIMSSLPNNSFQWQMPHCFAHTILAQNSSLTNCKKLHIIDSLACTVGQIDKAQTEPREFQPNDAHYTLLHKRCGLNSYSFMVSISALFLTVDLNAPSVLTIIMLTVFLHNAFVVSLYLSNTSTPSYDTH
jgi:hypothetical protein